MSIPLNSGVFLLSIDTELAWGGVHSGSFVRRRHMYEGTRDAISRLLEIAERYDIRATWAVVGHLLLDKCTPVNGRKHPELVRPSYSWFSGDWLKHDPCSDAAMEPFWYGPDIVESIMSCRSRSKTEA